jgi:hypothetical protein
MTWYPETNIKGVKGDKGDKGDTGSVGDINLLPTKTTLVDADATIIADSEDAGANKKSTWGNLKANLSTVFAPFSHVGLGGSAHALVIASGAAGFLSGADKLKLDDLNSANYAPIAHVGAGGSAHAIAVSGGAAGFLSGADKLKLDGLNSANYVAKAGDTMTGALTIASAAGYPSLSLDKTNLAAGNFVMGKTAGVSRWIIYLGDNANEPGDNSGSNFSIRRYDDAGTLYGTVPLGINRADGIVAMANGATIGSSVLASGGNITAGASFFATGSYFVGSADAVYLGTNTGGTGQMLYLRPVGYASATGQTTISAAGHMSVAGQISVGSSSACILQSNNAAGAPIYLRPYNFLSTNQTIIDAAGAMTVAGGVTSAGGYITSTGAHFIGSQSFVVLGTAIGGTGQMLYLRPVAYNSTTGQTAIAANGDMTVAGAFQAGGAITTTGQMFNSTQTTVLLASAAGGTVSLHPNASGSTTGRLQVTTTGLGVFGAAPAARGALALPTGTIQRTTYATGSVTLPQLAGVVMAIITDLRAMGFFS